MRCLLQLDRKQVLLSSAIEVMLQSQLRAPVTLRQPCHASGKSSHVHVVARKIRPHNDQVGRRATCSGTKMTGCPPLLFEASARGSNA